MNAAVTVLFLGALAVILLCAARVALWLLTPSQPDPTAVDALADTDARRADDWSRDEWWR